MTCDNWRCLFEDCGQCAFGPDEMELSSAGECKLQLKVNEKQRRKIEEKYGE